ncbi:MAG TPA: redoxin domain-containing protein [Terracidiphilus sp.]|jgi:peroxiredoxin
MRFRPELEILTVSALLLLPIAAVAQARVNSPAPEFTATDSHGQTHTLDQYRGKYVVLEWHNQGCPFTRKHYESGNMQNLQKEWTEKGVVWFTVISSAPGTQGYVTPSQENDYLAKMHAAPSAVLLDPDGKLGRLYAARTTPDMYVIDPQGKLIYSGAIDNRPTPDESDIQGADNFVNDALTAATSGKAVAMPYTRAYGCSVKYRE